MPIKKIEQCGALLIERGLTLAFAESATAGRACMEFSLCEDAGKFLKGGLVCYDAELKESILRISKDLIKQFTPESAEVTKAIAEGLMPLINADIYIGITGLTSSGGSEGPEKPVGTMFFCILRKTGASIQSRKVFNGNPEQIIEQAVNHLAEMVYGLLK